MINIATMVRTVERAVKLLPIVKDLLPCNSKSDPELYKLVKKVKQQEQTIYAKKNEIEILKKKIELLQETIGGYQS